MFSDNFYPELSGISDSIITTGSELTRRGHTVVYYAPHYSQKDFRVTGLPDVPTIGPGMPIHRLPSVHYKAGTGQTRAVLPLLTSLPSLIAFKPDVIHFHHIFGAGIEAVFASKILGKPLVETVHTPILEFFFYSLVQTDWMRRFTVHYDAWFYNRSDFVSSPTRTIFESMPFTDSAIPHRPVSNPINIERFRPAPAAGRGTDTKQRPFTILYTGRLAEEKNIHLVIRAAAAAQKDIPDLRIILVGKGAYEAELRTLVRTLGMERAVTFAGFVSDEELPSFYAQSDVFAIMSTAETQCIAAMQAFACGIPVIATDTWGFKDYVVPGTGYLMQPGDVEGLSEKLVFLYRHPAERKKMGAAGQKHVAQFSIPAVADTWEKIYKEVIERYNKKI